MNRHSFARPMAVAAAFILLCAASELARAQSTPSSAEPTPALPGDLPNADSLNDFAGLNYTDEQKTEIDKIRRDTATHKDAVEKDDKLTSDQKDAMLLGYTRLEYGFIYKLLTPEQRRQVRNKILARRAANKAPQSQHPQN